MAADDPRPMPVEEGRHTSYNFAQPDGRLVGRLPKGSTERLRNTLALLAVLSLSLQLLVPVVGGTVRLLLAGHDHTASHGHHDHGSHGGGSEPGLPSDEHGH